jgi:hypothetical protein
VELGCGRVGRVSPIFYPHDYLIHFFLPFFNVNEVLDVHGCSEYVPEFFYLRFSLQLSRERLPDKFDESSIDSSDLIFIAQCDCRLHFNYGA